MRPPLSEGRGGARGKLDEPGDSPAGELLQPLEAGRAVGRQVGSAQFPYARGDLLPEIAVCRVKSINEVLQDVGT